VGIVGMVMKRLLFRVETRDELESSCSSRS
jgi:hypothetical protein